MAGHIRKVKNTKNKWKIVVEAGKDPVTGKRKRIVRYHTGRESEAKNIMALIIAELEQGTHVDIDKITVIEWMEEWLREYKKPTLRPSTYELYAYYIDHFIRPTLGNVPLQKLRPEHLQRLYNSLIEDGKSSRAVHQVHQLFNGAFKQAIKNRIIKFNPCEATTRPPLKYKEKRIMTVEEQDKLLNALADHKLGAAFVTMLGTGLRREEVIGLHWEDVDPAIDAYVAQLEKEKELWELTKNKASIEEVRIVEQEIKNLKNERYIQIVRSVVAVKGQGLVVGEPKTAKSRRTIPLPTMVVTFLLKHREHLQEKNKYQKDSMVFPSRAGTYIWPRNLSRSFEQLRDKLDLNHISPHALRHTFASRLLELGEDMKVIQELLGHSKYGTTADIYAHVADKLKRQAINRLDDVMGTKKENEGTRAPNGHQKGLRRIK